MKTQLKTDTYEITLTNINADSISFNAKLTLTYLLATKSDNNSATDVTEFFNDYSHDNFIDIGFTATDSQLYYGILHNHAGSDIFDDIDDAIASYGTPIVDFIISHCKLLNIPLYPNR